MGVFKISTCSCFYRLVFEYQILSPIFISHHSWAKVHPQSFSCEFHQTILSLAISFVFISYHTFIAAYNNYAISVTHLLASLFLFPMHKHLIYCFMQAELHTKAIKSMAVELKDILSRNHLFSVLLVKQDCSSFATG